MIQKIEILERLISLSQRFFKVNFRANETKNATQYNSGGDDYNPPEKVEALGGFIYDNPAHGAVFAYKDNIEKIAQPGEKRIYATDSTGENVVSSIYLKNNGDVIINATGKIYFNGEIVHTGNSSQTGNSTITGTLNADIINAGNGANGTLDKPEVTNGIVTGGS